MSFKSLISVVALSLLAFGAIRPAQAQFAVIDVASLTQLIQEYETLQQELATARSQLAQAQAQYSAITGNRGMQNLLSGTQRNYLPDRLGSGLAGDVGVGRCLSHPRERCPDAHGLQCHPDTRSGRLTVCDPASAARRRPTVAGDLCRRSRARRSRTVATASPRSSSSFRPSAARRMRKPRSISTPGSRPSRECSRTSTRSSKPCTRWPSPMSGHACSGYASRRSWIRGRCGGCRRWDCRTTESAADGLLRRVQCVADRAPRRLHRR